MKKNSTYTFLLLFSFFLLSAQQKKADSLLTILKSNNLSKQERASILLDIVTYHPNIQIALNSAKKSLKLAEEIKSPNLQARSLIEISILQRQLGFNNLSISASLKALKIFKKLKIRDEQATCYSHIATSYAYDKDYLAAIAYFKKAIKYTNIKNEISNVVLTLNLGEAYRELGQLDSAKIYIEKSLLKNSTVNVPDGFQGYILGNLGMVYIAENKIIDAKKNLNEAIAILSKLNDPYSTSTYIAALGQAYLKENKKDIAEKKLIEAYQMAKKNSLKDEIRNFSKMLAELYEETEQFPKALKYQKLFQIYQDSLVNKDNIKKLEQLKASYEIDKRETEISLLNTINKSQKKWMLSLIFGLSLLILLSYLLYRGNLKAKRSNKLLAQQKEVISKREQEKALLLRELNHRVKNNLQMISSLLNLQSNKLSGHPAQEAIITGRQRVEALSLVHRKLYQEGVDTRIHVKEYISELILGLFHGFDANFEPEFDIADVNVNIDAAIPLALIVNEIVINALKYAYAEITAPALKVHIQPAGEKRLSIQISDNGIGFKDSDASKKTNSLGLKIINSLIHQLDGSIQKTIDNGTHWKMDVKVG
ncbi:tetratricopeptide repeat-containing sensor histidine kinase [Aquimarina agarilytica]|uniref:tetratricopeptide repeat-containing sensor histidine kinase n=1 Tax=Aquimarina agarilytica TaxID=1087449 RepID=UPI000287F29B|nr:histidine kinase dimerization/phosphoacceptor domain -containing protein [Aquimarina agarilytica]